MTSTRSVGPGNSVVLAILSILGLYLLSALAGMPQHATELVAAGHSAVAHAEGTAAEQEHVTHSSPDAAHGSGGEHHAAIVPPPYWTVIPFVLLLGAIAVFPLMNSTSHWWEENVNRFKVSAVLALLTLAYFGFLHHSPIEGHWPAHQVVEPTAGGLQAGLIGTVLGNAILGEFVPFIVLLFSLYVIAGGIRIEGDLQANPLTNASFMAVGGLLASFIGTTGAAMLLIRPLLETNKERRFVSHTVIFFIFIVCNCGGCLLPIGDPPLFLGYLHGVDFTWTLSLWEPWLFVNGLLLLVYCLVDQFLYHPRESVRDIQRDVAQTRRLKISGWAINVPLLLGVVLAVALLDPNKAVPGTDWHAWMFLREIAQLCLVAMSLYFGSRMIREQNNFNYHAIVEVAALFMGIFICMQPALQILGAMGTELVEKFQIGPGGFFWLTGALSAFLDNAPTYLVFFKTAQVPGAVGATGGVPETILVGIALGAVFMGAMTYIGNGPNFMVKAIAETSGVKMPSFFGYMVYSCIILLPILALTHWRYLADTDQSPSAQAAQQAVVSAADHPS